MTSHAFLQANRTGTIDGPLQGYHREWYVVRPGNELMCDLGRVKVGEPRDGVPWFDQRYFPSEEELLLKLGTLPAPRVPPVRRLDTLGLVVHGFVEGRALNDYCPAGTPVPEHYLEQILSVFAELTRVRAGTVRQWKLSGTREVREGDSARFLRDLIRFTRKQGHEANRLEFGALFRRLGISGRALESDARLTSEANRLSPRPFCLLHGDLHRANFIIDPSEQLWTIDWELATPGDPLYELATHLHLMKYPPEQERDVKARWRRLMGEVLPEAVSGMDADLPRYLAYKRAQSVFTDVVRHAIALRGTARSARTDQLQRTAKTIEDVLVRARDVLNLEAVPAGAIESAFDEFCFGR